MNHSERVNNIMWSCSPSSAHTIWIGFDLAHPLIKAPGGVENALTADTPGSCCIASKANFPDLLIDRLN